MVDSTSVSSAQDRMINKIYFDHDEIEVKDIRRSSIFVAMGRVGYSKFTLS